MIQPNVMFLSDVKNLADVSHLFLCVPITTCDINVLYMH